MNCVHDTKALELSREVMAIMYGPIPTGGSVQLQAKIQCLFADAMDFAAGNSPAIPDGYVLVPIVPTEDMIINGFESEPDPHFSDEKEWEEYKSLSGCRQAARRAELCWAAMIKTAPKKETL